MSATGMKQARTARERVRRREVEKACGRCRLGQERLDGPTRVGFALRLAVTALRRLMRCRGKEAHESVPTPTPTSVVEGGGGTFSARRGGPRQTRFFGTGGATAAEGACSGQRQWAYRRGQPCSNRSVQSTRQSLLGVADETYAPQVRTTGRAYTYGIAARGTAGLWTQRAAQGIVEDPAHRRGPTHRVFGSAATDPGTRHGFIMSGLPAR